MSAKAIFSVLTLALLCAGCGGGGGGSSSAPPPLTVTPSDLVVGTVLLSPSNPVDPATVTITVPIRNAGDATSPATTVTIISAATPGNPSQQDSQAVPALAHLAITSVQFQLTGVTAGSYSFTVSVAPVPGETVTANNTGNFTVVVAPTGSG